MARSPRLEWISVIYLVLFVLAILSPSLVRNDYFGLPEDRIEELLIFLFGIAGLATFSLYERVMERRERERDEALSDRDKARKELVSSYEYIGAINRQIDALKKLANETAVSLVEADRIKKGIFQSLAAGAAALMRADHCELRVVALDKLRTLKEFRLETADPLRVSNRDLLTVHEHERSHCFVRGEDGREILVVPSDRKDSTCKTFMLLSTSVDTVPEVDPGLLKVYANQAEVLYRVLASKGSRIREEDRSESELLAAEA
ncbi:hypothetical protein KJZ71_01640 [Patescibacteria group bacterium]|uniref:Uncharacterized protein n=1 Tax=candidate division WWE3 bacterium TaxID=2053526 RepID=A0A928TTR3_UNCKA|nr:hypothetical protein [candidate division WWE3 bacterium]MCL4732489.1 hypothetical protein [Patescibacteria group bacterium]MDL1952603.1 hypothetical protein [Candidatus Uhrbacteria bacterium UHB]RIL01265.1 MAG: hypothetical protein DCC77_01860 [Candidatus Uhrbacteria bacterium]